METINLFGGWAGILLGFVAGAVPGLFFHDELWLGGYASWRRRMIRLAHISFFGIGFINLAFFFTVRHFGLLGGWGAPIALTVAAGAMPLTCMVSAFWKPFRHVFALPVLCVLVPVAMLLVEVIRR